MIKKADIGAAQSADSILETAAASAQNTNQNSKSDDIMSVLLAHEKRANNNTTANAVKSLPGDESDSSSDDLNEVKVDHNEIGKIYKKPGKHALYAILYFS